MSNTQSRRQAYTKMIKDEALRLGFISCGISKAEFLEEEAPQFEKWLNANMHGNMRYMENHFDKRLDPTLLVEGAKSVVSLLYNYFPKKKMESTQHIKISKYAYGEDYHFVIKDKLRELMSFIRDKIDQVDGRIFVDSAPVMERAWAKKSGLGWIGKNSNLLTKKVGSFYFIAELIIDLECEYDHVVVKDACGSCTRCIDACPTGAIEEPRVVNGSKCISYFTIELKEAIPNEAKGKLDGWAFGCDICQDVCPWNKFARPHDEKRFEPNPRMFDMTDRDWVEITEEVYGKLFKKSAVKRAKFLGLKRNIDFVKKGSHED